MLSVALYIASIAGINWAFALVGANLWTNCVAGLVFIFRDMAQREVGHRIWYAMLVAIALSYLLADPRIALASATAFAVSEVVDWGVYSYMRMPWRDRMLASSAVSTPIDSAVFLWMGGFWSVHDWGQMSAAKLGVALALWWILMLRKPRFGG